MRLGNNAGQIQQDSAKASVGCRTEDCTAEYLGCIAADFNSEGNKFLSQATPVMCQRAEGGHFEHQLK